MSRNVSSQQQQTFSSRMGFVFAALAASVGLSNIWRFSAEASFYGGGTYVVVYLLCVGVVGYPILLFEFSFGRNNPKGLSAAFAQQGRWRWIAPFASAVCFMIFCFYNIVAGWVVHYVWHLADGALSHVQEQGEDVGSYSAFFEMSRGCFVRNLACTLFMVLVAVFINQAGISNGIERCARVLMPVFVVVMAGLIVYALSLEHSWEGVACYLWPNMQGITLARFGEIFAAALSQVLMSIGIGMCAMVVYATYMKGTDNLYKSAAIVVLGDTAVAVAAGLFLFAFLGNAQMIGFLSEHKSASTGLAFAVLPYSLYTHLSPVVATVVLGLFFSLLFFAAITSSISMLETPTQYVTSHFPAISRRKAIWLLAGCSCVVSVVYVAADAGYLGSWLGRLHDTFQDVTVKVLLPLSTFLFSLFIARKWKVARVFEEANRSGRPNKYVTTYLTVAARFLAPLLTGASFVHTCGSYLLG